VGLGSICLQLHSRSANKRLVLAEIEETLKCHTAAPDPAAECAQLKELRDMKWTLILGPGVKLENGRSV
jgi:hypothetical protein